MKYRKKPVIIEAKQWFKHGDNDSVKMHNIELDAAMRSCKHCASTIHHHGLIDTLEGCHIVCPGDFIITGVKGEKYPCKPDIFEATYEQVDD